MQRSKFTKTKLFNFSSWLRLALAFQIAASSCYLPAPAFADDSVKEAGATNHSEATADNFWADTKSGAKPTAADLTSATAEPKVDSVTSEAPAISDDAQVADASEEKDKARLSEADKSTEADGKEIAAKGAPPSTSNDAAVPEIRPDDNTVSKEGIGGFVGGGDESELALLEKGYVEASSGGETLGDVITVDNDEAVEIEETIAYADLPTDEGKTRIKTGAQFPVVMASQFSSKTTKKGDVCEARLKYDLKIGDRLIAEKGSLVRGHVDYCLPARSVMHSLVSPTRWYKNSGCIGLYFDDIINKNGEHIALNAKPAQKARIIKNKAEGRLLGVNHNGQIVGPWGQQLRYKAIRIGLNFALAPAGVFSFGAMPVALGVIGAVNPSFAFMKPVGTNVRHRRIKGFAWGFLSGVPGSWIIEDTVTKGQEAIVKPGDEFLVELKQEFTGEARSEATLMPGSAAKVRGQVVKDPSAKKSTRSTKSKSTPHKK